MKAPTTFKASAFLMYLSCFWLLFGAISNAQNKSDGVLDFSNGKVSKPKVLVGVGFRNEDRLLFETRDGAPFTTEDGFCFLTGVIQPDEWGSIGLGTSQDTGQWLLIIRGGHKGESGGKRTQGVARCVKF